MEDRSKIGMRCPALPGEVSVLLWTFDLAGIRHCHGESLGKTLGFHEKFGPFD